jgi:hypothetical protein
MDAYARQHDHSPSAIPAKVSGQAFDPIPEGPGDSEQLAAASDIPAAGRRASGSERVEATSSRVGVAPSMVQVRRHWLCWSA